MCYAPTLTFFKQRLRLHANDLYTLYGYICARNIEIYNGVLFLSYSRNLLKRVLYLNTVSTLFIVKDGVDYYFII